MAIVGKLANHLQLSNKKLNHILDGHKTGTLCTLKESLPAQKLMIDARDLHPTSRMKQNDCIQFYNDNKEIKLDVR